MDFLKICKEYALGEFREAVPLEPGSAAQVWRLDTSEGSFLVRTLAGKAQGEREWMIYRHLSACGFHHTPAILTTSDGCPMAEADDGWYQVQQLLTGPMPDPADRGVAVAMARTLRELARCMPEGLIHGDLGPWNMICNGDGSISVIDFGAARPGDFYFDFAAAFGGIINHTPAEKRNAVCGEFLRELRADRKRLLEQLRLWAEEGTAQWSGRNEKMAARFYHALKWAEENLYAL